MGIALVLIESLTVLIIPMVGVPLIILGSLINWHNEDKTIRNWEEERERRRETISYYASSKWRYPTSQETIAAANALNGNPLCKSSNHKAFLKRQIDRLKTEFTAKGVYSNFPQITNWNSQEDAIDFLFETPANYLDVPEYS